MSITVESRRTTSFKKISNLQNYEMYVIFKVGLQDRFESDAIRVSECLNSAIIATLQNIRIIRDVRTIEC